MTRRTSTSPLEVPRPRTLVGLTKRTLMHELQVHQVELEQQNEELLRAQLELVAARDRFIDLFDFAPVAYLTLDRAGRIVEANLTAAAEFATERPALLGRPFAQFVVPADSDRWQRVAARTLARNDLRRVELTLIRPDGRHFQAELDCRAVAGTGSDTQLRLTLTEVSQRRLAAKNRRIAASGYVARESERRAMALRLHEGLGQRLAAIKLHLGRMTPPAGAVPKEAVVEKMAAELDQALALVRRMSTDLHPLMLNDLGLGAALDWLVRDVAVRLGLAATLHFDEDEDDAALEPALAIALYRLVEAALTHFAQHVEAGISVELLRRPRDWVLLFQSLPGHLRKGAPASPLMAWPQAFRDQVHLLGGRLETSELPGDIRRATVFIGTRQAGVPGLWPFDDTA